MMALAASGDLAGVRALFGESFLLPFGKELAVEYSTWAFARCVVLLL